MRKSNSFILLGLSVIALSACGTSDDKSNWGSLDDITVNNRGIAPAKKVSSKTASKEDKLEEVKKEVNQAIDDEAPKAKSVAVKKAMDEVAKTPNDANANQDIKANQDAVTEVKMSEPVNAVQEMAEKKDEVKNEVKEVKPMSRAEMRPSPEVIAKRKAELAAERAKKEAVANNMSGDLPANAKPGECYAKVLIPAKVEGVEETVQVSEEQKVLARIIPAKYEVKRERVLVKEATQVWKPGRGAKEKINQTTGEILCLVEEPAIYKTIEKRVLIAPETPEYKIIPAKFQTITHTKTIEPATMEWRRILCETNVTPSVIMSIQKALNNKGYNSGVIDGRLGSKTLRAIEKYQRDNNLPLSGLSYDTIDSLGVKL